jgi:hypothetical protein
MFLRALRNFTVKKLKLPIYFVPTIGLGNQLFQLSALINLSQQCDRKVYVCWDEQVGATFQELLQFLKVYNYSNFLKIKLPFVFQSCLKNSMIAQLECHNRYLFMGTINPINTFQM